eukprot:SM000091S24614  [mRNA]  locus=s91:363926:365620:- [translate_table: standard]
MVGACTGALCGALAGRATDSGIFRGAGLGAVAGAVVSLEALEATRSLLRSARAPSSLSSTVDYIEDVIQERFVNDVSVFTSATGRLWQVNVDDMSYDELYDMFGPGRAAMLGIPPSVLARLPCHVLAADNCHDASGAMLNCAVCLQDFEAGELARTLPQCRHTYHQECVDRWLSQQGFCPVCRQDIEC